MCSICRVRQPKAALLRFSLAFEGANPMPDHKQQAPGRGMYVCRTDQCQAAFSRRWRKREAKG
ncbi:DUF448 domain-containing protein [Desulfovibrio cuneatus]|uniref:DUF448 domain-containing protein n=1 Tax=Desulfovibrio cuneatus TaxID=159728 RepID=UPI0034E093E1